jgi:hypothetical protein
MRTSTDTTVERSELERIIASGIFHRAPNLARLLTYVCAKHFEGAADQIKEYNIAVDALGRPADFDQKRDSIVRVEAHRLRKRLRDYYDAEGADHAVRIEIPPGQYAPQFLRTVTVAPSLSEETLVAQTEPFPSAEPVVIPAVAVPSPVVSASRAHSPVLPLTLLMVFCFGAIALWNRPIRRVLGVGVSAAPVLPAGAAGTQEIRILAGHTGAAYTDHMGRIWNPDRYYQGGYTFETTDHPIWGTREPRIYQGRREGPFQYDIPMAPGVYELRLHFAETLFGENNVAGGGESSRVFAVHINGKEVLNEFDVISEAGASTANIRAFKDVSPTADGKLHIKFDPVTNVPLLNAIEITPGTPGRLRPIRMISLDRAYTDKQGNVWEPELYVRGGQLVTRTTLVHGASDPELFHGERFGNLRYVVPVPPGRYAVTMYFSELWFGPGTPPGGGAGSRIFDIFVNGQILRHSFDIFKEAKGSDRAVTYTAHGLEPDAQGKLNIALMPTRNYACINAIEIVEEN